MMTQATMMTVEDAELLAEDRLARALAGADGREWPAAGTVLVHRQRGEVLARATSLGDGRVRYAGRVWPSLSAAARACAERLGQRSRAGLNGWVYWGIVRRGRRPTRH